MFQNANFGVKWFYAFIKEVVWKSVNMCEVIFEIDIFQTWQFDFTFKPSYVLREHVNSDNIGEHLVDEGLSTGEYLNNGQQKTNYFNNMVLVMQTTADITQQVHNPEDTIFPKMIDGIVSGVNTYVFANPSNMLSQLFIAIDNLTRQGQLESIISLSMIPRGFLILDPNDLTTLTDVYFYSRNTETKNFICTLNNGIKNYTPKNKKLLTYPYTFLRCENGQGNSAEYRWEYLDNKNFNVRIDLSPNSSSLLYPRGYKSIVDNMVEKITLDMGIICSWSGSAYTNYLAQTKGSRLVKTIGSGIALGTSVASGNVLGMIGGAMGVASVISDRIDRQSMPLQSFGNTVSGNISYSSNALDYTFTSMCITDERAKIIDDYFTKYGYKINRLKVPNLTGRPYWNYVQTSDCTLVGNIPFNDISRLKTIFNSGVTIWHTDDIGNYNLNNTI